MNTFFIPEAKKIILFASLILIPVSSQAIILVTHIHKSYKNERKHIDGLIKSIRKATEAVKAGKNAEKESAKNQIRNQGNMTNTANQSEILLRQMSNYTKMEILRSESLSLQTKELLYEVWGLSSDISKRELEELRLNLSKNKK